MDEFAQLAVRQVDFDQCRTFPFDHFVALALLPRRTGLIPVVFISTHGRHHWAGSAGILRAANVTKLISVLQLVVAPGPT